MPSVRNVVAHSNVFAEVVDTCEMVAIPHPELPNLQLQVPSETFTIFRPFLSCIPIFFSWNHQHPFDQLVDDWWPYQLERVGYLSSCSLPAMGANATKTAVGFWRSGLCFRRNKCLCDQEEFANRSVMDKVHRGFDLFEFNFRVVA